MLNYLGLSLPKSKLTIALHKAKLNAVLRMRRAVLNFVVAEAYIARKAELLRSSAYYR